jgi:hypothetical protein
MKRVTFRTQTKGEIDDLLEDEGLQCALSQALVAVLVGELLHYAEEGRALTPSVMYCESAAEVTAGFPGSVRYEIGKTTLSADAGKQILKLCAPLATGSWHIFIERSDPSTLKFGVFKYLMLPTTAPLHEALEITRSEHFALVIRKTSLSSVEVRGSHGRHVNFLFSTVREDTVEHQPIDEFARVCCAANDSDVDHLLFVEYFKRMLERVLTACHGTILVCGDSERLRNEASLKDATWLQPPLDFWKTFKDYRTLDSSESILELQQLEELLTGLINSDGMVAFDGRGNVLAYRVFFTGQVAGSVPSQPAGGARRRAFEGVKALLGTSVKAVLLRSQDGNMLIAGGE